MSCQFLLCSWIWSLSGVSWVLACLSQLPRAVDLQQWQAEQGLNGLTLESPNQGYVLVSWETCRQVSKEFKNLWAVFSPSFGLSKCKLKPPRNIRFLFDVVIVQTSFPLFSWNVAFVSLSFFTGGGRYIQTTRTVSLPCGTVKSIFSKD